MGIALVTGASRGLGRAIAHELAERGWTLVVDARDGDALAEAERAIRPHVAPGASLVALAGDVADAGHRRALVTAAQALGGLDLLVNNASTLGATPAAESRVLPPRRARAGPARSTWWHRSPSSKKPWRSCGARHDPPSSTSRRTRRSRPTKGGVATGSPRRRSIT